MIVGTARKRDAPDNLIRLRVDHGNVVASLHVDEHTMRAGVVLHVPGLAAQ